MSFKKLERRNRWILEEPIPFITTFFHNFIL